MGGQVPALYRARHPEIPWRQGRGLRNVVVHRHFAVEQETVETGASVPLPALRSLHLATRKDQDATG